MKGLRHARRRDLVSWSAWPWALAGAAALLLLALSLRSPLPAALAAMPFLYALWAMPLGRPARQVACGLLALGVLAAGGAVIAGRSAGPDHEAAASLLLPKYPPERLAHILGVLDREGTSAALDELNRMLASGAVPENSQHEFTHVIGQFALYRYGGAAEALAACRFDFGWACYHGVLMEYAQTVPTLDPVVMTGLCADPSRLGGGGDPMASNGCWHGLGHGLAMAYHYDLPRMLAFCDAVPLEGRRPCLDGGFMENILAAADGRNPGYLRSEDPAYPCTALDERYLESCYREQMRAGTTLFYTDWKSIAAICRSAPEMAKQSCYDGLGGEIDGHLFGDYDRAFTECAVAESIYYRDVCVYGMIKLDRTRPTRERIPAICARMESPEAKLMCYDRLGVRMIMEGVPPAERASECARVEPAYRRTCEFGAGTVR